MTRTLSPQIMERIVTDALIAQHEAWFGWYDTGRTENFFDRLGEITLPTIVMGGDRDPLAPPSNVRATVGAIPGAISIFLKDVGHNLPIEAPAEVVQLLDRVTL